MAEEIKYKLDFVSVGLVARLDWKQDPKVNEEFKFLVSFSDTQEDLADNEFVDPGHVVEVSLWMPNCGPNGGHPSAPVTIKEVSPGVYEVSKAYFVMTGRWDVVLSLKKNDKLVDFAIQKLTIK